MLAFLSGVSRVCRARAPRAPVRRAAHPARIHRGRPCSPSNPWSFPQPGGVLVRTDRALDLRTHPPSAQPAGKMTRGTDLGVRDHRIGARRRRRRDRYANPGGRAASGRKANSAGEPPAPTETRARRRHVVGFPGSSPDQSDQPSQCGQPNQLRPTQSTRPIHTIDARSRTRPKAETPRACALRFPPPPPPPPVLQAREKKTNSLIAQLKAAQVREDRGETRRLLRELKKLRGERFVFSRGPDGADSSGGATHANADAAADPGGTPPTRDGV